MNIHLLLKPAVYITASYLVFFLYVADYVSVYKELFPTVVALSNSFVFFLLTWMVVLTSAQLQWLLLSRLFFHRLDTAERELVTGVFESKVLPICIFAMVLRVVDLSSMTLIALGAVIMRLLHTVAQERVVMLVTLSENRRVHFVLLARLALFFQFSFVFSVSTLTVQHIVAPSLSVQDRFVYDVAWIMNAQHICSVLYLTIRLFCQQMYGEHRYISTLTCLEFGYRFCMSVIIVSYTVVEFMLDRRPMYLIPVSLIALESMFRRIVRLWVYTDLTRMMRSLSNVTEDDLQQERRCIICYEDMTATAACKRLPCGHCYHEFCLLKWFRENDKCPYCRANPFTTLKAHRVREGAADAAAARAEPTPRASLQRSQEHEAARSGQHPLSPEAAALATPQPTPLLTTPHMAPVTRVGESNRAKPMRATVPLETAHDARYDHVLPSHFPTQETEAALHAASLTSTQREEIRLKLYKDYVNHVETVTQHLRSLLQQLEN